MPGRMIKRATLAALLAVVGALGLANVASAAVNGQLKQFPGTLGCLARTVAGCGNLNDPITNIGKPVLSPDGLHLYVPDKGTGSVVLFDRNPSTGVLTERSCYSFAAIGGCAVIGASPLQNATAVAVSGDGKSLYVVGGPAGGATDGVAHFTLSADGTPTFDSCFNGNGTAPCSNFGIFNGSDPSSVVVTPDLGSVYVGNGNASIVVFKRNTTTGALNQVGLSAAQKCIKQSADANACTLVNVLATVTDIAVTPDNKQLLVTAPDCGPTCSYAFLAFDRDPATSVLTRHPGPTGCIVGLNPDPNCTGRFYELPAQIAMSPDGRRIYLSNRPVCCLGYSAMMLVNRDPATGNLTPVTDWCVEAPGAPTDCAETSKALSDVYGVAFGPSGDLYTAGNVGQRIGVFDVNAGNGRISQKPGVYGCLAAPSQADACGGTLLQGGPVQWVVPSADGRFVYGLGAGRIFSFAVDHAPVCNNMTINTAFNTAVTMQLDCSDADGDPIAFEKLSDPARGTLGALQVNGSIAYGPLVGSSGADSFQFRATAGGVTADVATATLNVAGPAIVSPASQPTPPPGKILVTLGFAFSSSTNKQTKFTSMTVKGFPSGSTITVTCIKGTCPSSLVTKKKVKKKTKLVSKPLVIRNAKGTVKLSKVISKALKAGTRIRIDVTKAGMIGAVKILEVRKRKAPKVTTLCAPRRRDKPQSSCS